MPKTHFKIPNESKVMQVLKLRKLAYKPRPRYCFEMIFSKCHILCVVISKQLNSTIKLLYANVVFYHIESFSSNKILNNVKINEIYLI